MVWPIYVWCEAIMAAMKSSQEKDFHGRIMSRGDGWSTGQDGVDPPGVLPRILHLAAPVGAGRDSPLLAVLADREELLGVGHHVGLHGVAGHGGVLLHQHGRLLRRLHHHRTILLHYRMDRIFCLGELSRIGEEVSRVSLHLGNCILFFL